MGLTLQFHVTVYGAGELIILHSPSSVEFSGQEQVAESLVKEIFSVCMGFTVTKVQCTVMSHRVL
jgi:hypothetical protein